jgi:hypothetical protein
VILGLVLLGISVLIFGLVIGVAMEKGPTPGDVAQSYELAWDRHDFDALWSMGSDALRDGRNRAEFVADKRAAYRDQPRLKGIVEHVEIEAVAMQGRRIASVLTRLDLGDGPPVRNEIRMERKSGSWRVVGYTLRPATASTS